MFYNFVILQVMESLEDNSCLVEIIFIANQQYQSLGPGQSPHAEKNMFF